MEPINWQNPYSELHENNMSVKISDPTSINASLHVRQKADDERIVIDSRSFSEYNDDHTQALSPLAEDTSLEDIGDHGYSGTPIPISYLLSQRIIDQMVMGARGKATVRPTRPKGVLPFFHCCPGSLSIEYMMWYNLITRKQL